MIQSILSNLAIILLMHLMMTVIMNFKQKFSNEFRYILIIMIVSATVISLFYLPIRFNGYWVDMRMIPLIFFAAMHGWKIAIPVLIISSVWRFLMGGAGMMPGILYGMIGPTLFALLFNKIISTKKQYLTKISIVIGCWLISDLPIIFIIPNGLEIFKNIALIRSSSFVITAIILYTFITHERQRGELNQQLKKLADEDYLTKLLNKRKFLEIIESKMPYLEQPHYLAMLDIDFFKNLNDTYGHLAGDTILKKLGEIFKSFENEKIYIGRYGGEEFIIFLGGMTTGEAMYTMEKIREEIKTTTFHLDSGTKIHITISVGLVQVEPNTPLRHTINEADIQLYEAKNSGRDRINSTFSI